MEKQRIKELVKRKLPKRLYGYMGHIYLALMFQYRRVRYPISVMSTIGTLQHIKKTGCSVARFGDGELGMAVGKFDIGFQAYSDNLSDELREILRTEQKNLLICIPHNCNHNRGCNKKAKNFWVNWTIANKADWYPLLRKGTIWGDTLITRPYIDYKNKKNAEKIYPMLKELWEGKDLLIVEGEKTRLGVGNDLLSGAASIKRILAPAKDAFSFRQELLDEIKRVHTKELILLALGPTATVLASDCAKSGFQALDVGHVDVEYEWFLQGATEKIALSRKYVNEARNGSVVDNEEDLDYNAQIIARVGC